MTIEVEHGTGKYLRPLALRSCSGQKNWKQLDPLRFAAVATPALLALLPGLFHITTIANIASIVAHGLKPGHLLTEGGRKDVHFSPFTPYDNRNEMMREKMRTISYRTETWVCISVNPAKCPRNSLRLCQPNSIVLSTEIIPAEAFDGIWTLSWFGSTIAQQRWTYEPKMETFEVSHFRGDHVYSNGAVASLITEGQAAYGMIVQECADDSCKRMAHYQTTKSTPISAEEQRLHIGIPLRRCPSCLKPTAARMTYCFCCKAEFLGRTATTDSSGRSPARNAPFRIPPKLPAPDVRSSRASSAPPETTKSVVKLELPKVEGVTWKVEAHGGYEYVHPGKRMTQSVDENGKNRGAPG